MVTQVPRSPKENRTNKYSTYHDEGNTETKHTHTRISIRLQHYVHSCDQVLLPPRLPQSAHGVEKGSEGPATPPAVRALAFVTLGKTISDYDGKREYFRKCLFWYYIRVYAETKRFTNSLCRI